VGCVSIGGFAAIGACICYTRHSFARCVAGLPRVSVQFGAQRRVPERRARRARAYSDGSSGEAVEMRPLRARDGAVGGRPARDIPRQVCMYITPRRRLFPGLFIILFEVAVRQRSTMTCMFSQKL
jgi:hypothetical protein